MAWAKLDDQFHSHRKAKQAWKADRGALGLHLLAMSYCAGQLTDGLVDDEFVEEKLPAKRERQQVTDGLVAAGLWVREDDGWRINDWLAFNVSRADTLDKRQREAERKARARGAPSASRPANVRADTSRTARGRDAVSDDPPARVLPDPTRPLESGGARAPDLVQPTDPLDGVDDQRLTETVQILRQCSRLQFDVELLGVSHALRAHPDADHVQAAHVAVSNAADPNYRTIDAGRALRYAIADLQRQRPARQRSDPPAKSPAKPDKPWKGALRPLVDQQRQRQRDNPDSSEAA